VNGRTVALVRCGARLGALENRCPHQGGPLGEGSIENGWLRCPWHGYYYDPLTGRPPEGFSDGADSYEVAERVDGVYMRLPASTTPNTADLRYRNLPSRVADRLVAARREVWSALF
jgi:pyruvate oxidase